MIRTLKACAIAALVSLFALLAFPEKGSADDERLIMRPAAKSSLASEKPAGKSGPLIVNAGKRQYEYIHEGSTPLEPDCIIDASRRFHVPVSIILTVLDVEGGSVGMNASNRNKTGDLGPMQINTCHLDTLKKNFGITKLDIQTNGCLNVQVGAWLLRKHLDEANNNALEAIGRYHSKNVEHKTRYQADAVKAYTSLRSDPAAHIDRVLEKSNKIFAGRQ